jgi:hypothetical protein
MSSIRSMVPIRRSIAVGDFNGDGNADLAIANQGSHSVSILLGNGTGGFSAPVTFGTGGTSPTAVAVGDFDGDGQGRLGRHQFRQ